MNLASALRRLAGALAAVTVTATVALTPAPASALAAPASAVTAGRTAYVSVSVATVWRSPTSPRPIDAPALKAPVQIRTWLAAMSTADRRGLGGRADTQLLLGEPVRVLKVSGSWAQIAAPGQPSPRDSRGYPGWVPLRQLSSTGYELSGTVATVVARTAWLRTADSRHARVTELSFGTRLRVASSPASHASWTYVLTPLGTKVVATTVIRKAVGGGSVYPVTGADLVRTAESFRGLPYLWAGTSGFGFDCSGLTYLTYRTHGIVLPRDASAQARAGRAVSRASLRAGDLVFFARNGVVHHVAMYAGNGYIVQAPGTGGVVEVVRLSTSPLAKEYAGARRFL